MQIRSHGAFCHWQHLDPLIKYPREAKKDILEYSLGVAWEPISHGRLAASHSDVVNDIRFVMAAILDFHL